MRLGSLAMVNRSVAERERLLEQRAAIEIGALNVLIGGQSQDDEMVELVRPVIVGEINGRVRRLEADLRSLGVDLG